MLELEFISKSLTFINVVSINKEEIENSIQTLRLKNDFNFSYNLKGLEISQNLRYKFPQNLIIIHVNHLC